MRIYGGIITYQPNLDRLSENIEAVINQVEKLIIIDNGSNSQDEIITLCKKYCEKIDIYTCKKNLGIGQALFTLMEIAISAKVDWILTLDQDSVVFSGLINQYKKYITPNIGIMTCAMKDRNYDIENLEMSKCLDIDYCITSGSLMNVAAYKKSRGYSKELFIDYVDFDICFYIKELGYRIIRIPYLGLLHEYGKGKKIKILGNTLLINGHILWREYYKAKNYILLRKRHKEYITLKDVLRHEIGMYIKVLMGEKAKIKRMIIITQGIFDGIKGKSRIKFPHYIEGVYTNIYEK